MDNKDRINELTNMLIDERKRRERAELMALANAQHARDTGEMLDEAKRQLSKAEQRLDDARRGYKYALDAEVAQAEAHLALAWANTRPSTLENEFKLAAYYNLRKSILELIK